MMNSVMTMQVRRIMWSSPLEFIASRGGDAKAIGKFHQRGHQSGGIGGRGVEGVVGKKIGGAALLEEFAEAVEIAHQGPLMTGVGDAGAEHGKGRVEKNDGGGVAGEELAVGGLEKRATT